MVRIWVVVALALGACSSVDPTARFEQAVTSTITTNAATYSPGQPVIVSWADLPGNANDWIAIADAGSPPTSVLRWVYTGGAISGSHTFAGPTAAGNYVARAFVDDSYTLLAESAFAVAGTSVTTNLAAYATGPITVTWSGLPGTSTDWIAIAPQGSPATTVTSWIYTGGAAAGSHNFSAPAPGTYVARAFPNDTYSIAGESAAFEVGTSVTTAASYAVGDPITVAWAHLTANVHDWIGLAPAGSPTTTVIAWVYTNGANAGSYTFGGLAAGNYVARAFLDDSYQVLVESAVFQVGGTPPPPPPVGTISVDHPVYGWGQDIVVTWSGFPGNAKDWITLAPQGSPDPTTTVWFYTGGAASGTRRFVNGLPTVGMYVARGFLDDSSTKIAQSTAFKVQDACVNFDPAPTTSVIRTDLDAAQFKNTRAFASLTISTNISGVEHTLPCIETIAGDLAITSGDPLTGTYRHLKGVHLPRLRTVTGKLSINDVEVLSTPRIDTVGSLVVAGTSLGDLTALSTLTDTGSIQISDYYGFNFSEYQYGVTSLHGLEGITSVSGNVSITLGSGIMDLEGLDNLATIGGNLTAYRLASMHGLDSLTSVGGDAYLSAKSYDTGLGSLVSVGGYLRLYGPELPHTSLPLGCEVTTFTSLTTVGGALWFLCAPHHVNLPKLQYVYDFNLYDGPTLVELTAPMLTRVVDHFVVLNDPYLPLSVPQGILQQLSPGPMSVQISGCASCPPPP